MGTDRICSDHQLSEVSNTWVLFRLCESGIDLTPGHVCGVDRLGVKLKGK